MCKPQSQCRHKVGGKHHAGQCQVKMQSKTSLHSVAFFSPVLHRSRSRWSGILGAHEFLFDSLRRHRYRHWSSCATVARLFSLWGVELGIDTIPGTWLYDAVIHGRRVELHMYQSSMHFIHERGRPPKSLPNRNAVLLGPSHSFGIVISTLLDTRRDDTVDGLWRSFPEELVRRRPSS